jgi:predicted nucleic acid-binding protein
VSLFVDTSAWHAAADSGDASNVRAKEILSTGDALVTTNHILVETWTLLRWRIGREAAKAFWEALRTGVATLETVGPADLQAAWTTGRNFPDQDSSLVDRTSFAAMERLGLQRVATFDDDFAVYRYGASRTKAFEVVR